MNQQTNPETATGPVSALTGLLGTGLFMPPGSVTIRPADDNDEMWADVPDGNVLIRSAVLWVRRSQHSAFLAAIRSQDGA